MLLLLLLLFPVHLLFIIIAILVGWLTIGNESGFSLFKMCFACKKQKELRNFIHFLFVFAFKLGHNKQQHIF